MLPEKTLPGWQGLCGPQLSVPEPQRGNRVNQSPETSCRVWRQAGRSGAKLSLQLKGQKSSSQHSNQGWRWVGVKWEGVPQD